MSEAFFLADTMWL